MDQNSNNNAKKFFIILAVLIVALVLIVVLRKSDNQDEYDVSLASVNEVEVILKESFPVEVDVLVKGDLPDGCTSLSEEISQRLIGNEFSVELKTMKLKDADVMCTQALVPFEKTISLENVVGIAAGDYTVNVNGVTKNFKMDVDNYISDVDPLK
ncbi:MAG: inhibitor of cysteine peptidase [Patescibacteria group bacterium]|jgi:inhibitor of cysteine peptidase|nr:inhibitor of cysteine peptidase [Patescibacteria group bacterium]